MSVVAGRHTAGANDVEYDVVTRRRAGQGRDWESRWATRLRLLDGVLVLSATATALLGRFGVAPPGLSNVPLPPLHSYAAVSVGLSIGWLVALAAGRSYDRRVVSIGVDEFRRVVTASMWFWGLVAIGCYLARVDLARGYIAIAFPLGTTLLVAGRYAARRWLRRLRDRSATWFHRVLVVGDHRGATEIVEQLGREPRVVGFRFVGACLPQDTDREGFIASTGLPVLGDLAEASRIARDADVDAVAVASSDAMPPAEMRRLGWALEGSGVDLVVAPSLTDVAGPRVLMRPVAGLPLLYVEQPEFTGARRVVKGVLDRVVAAVGLLALLPLLLLVALAIKLDTPGPVLFRQRRIGMGGRVFHVYKFRSMVHDAEQRRLELLDSNETDGLLFKIRCDPRVTLVGRLLRRFSLDELPQLLNVLRGDMSLVGPRPLPVEDEEFTGDARRRTLVKPGITGLWQVSGRSELPWEESVRLDLYYVENWSLTEDLLILARTAGAVLGGNGAY